jgi:hypothetical protein
MIGLGFVLFMISFGGTIVSIFWKARGKQESKLLGSIESLERGVVALTISHAKLEAKIDMLAERYDKDINNLGSKLRNLQV